MSEFKEIHGNRKCPCESGDRYASCCQQKNFQWVENKDRELARRLPMSLEVESILKEKLESFRSVFGREPEADDRVFFELNAYVPPETFVRDIAQAMAKAGIDPAFIYAFQKTGWIVTDFNHDQIPVRDLEDWKEAIREFDDGEVELFDSPDAFNDSMISVEILVMALKSKLIDKVGVIIARILQIRSDTPAIDAGATNHKDARREFAYFCLARGFQAMKSAITSAEQGFIGDALACVRTLYEAYLQLLYVRHEEEGVANLVEGQIGLERGTHDFEVRKKHGNFNTRVIVRKQDGRPYRNDISPSKMARTSLNKADHRIFESLYGKLSREAHPHIRSLERQKVNGKLSPIVNPDIETPVVHTCMMVVLLLEQVYLLEDDGESNLIWRDIEHAVWEIALLLVGYFEGLREVAEPVFKEYPPDYVLRLRQIEIPKVAERFADIFP